MGGVRGINDGPCSFDGCEKHAWEGGLCNAHYEYMRRRKHDPLIGTRKPGPKSKYTEEEKSERAKISTAAWRERNPDKHRAIGLRRHAKAREFVASLKDKPCTDCGIKYPYYVMQFDHLPGEQKEFTIGTHRTLPKEVLIAEANKCDVVCANCHAVRTWKRRHGEN